MLVPPNVVGQIVYVVSGIVKLPAATRYAWLGFRDAKRTHVLYSLSYLPGDTPQLMNREVR